MPKHFDKLDLRILDELQRDATIPLTELATRVNSSKSVCWRRIQRFIDEDIITSRVTLLDADKLGFGVMILLFIKIDGRGVTTMPDVIEAFRKIPEVVECHAMMGEVDLFAKVIVPTIKDFENLLWVRLSAIPGVADINSSISLTQFINTTRLPLEVLPAQG